NFIAGLNGETEATYRMNLNLLRALRAEGLWLRRINIRQVEGQGFQEIPEKTFKEFKREVREQIDRPLLKEMLPAGTILRDVWWETHDDRIRRPEQVLNPSYREEGVRGKAGVTFGRQIGAYPILVGVPYKIPLETSSDIVVTGHGNRSITGVEVGLDVNTATQHQLQAVPGIGSKGAWRLVSARARETEGRFSSTEQAFDVVNLELPDYWQM
ncbi:MAG: helix-hairpin-helix domain-containing protein, partial [Candidatus Thermoplasmatota archaeon]|nr:helix-hairpin-helix domain-containing protein [Candidatus Thermoplasmatota archaeon]